LHTVVLLAIGLAGPWVAEGRAGAIISNGTVELGVNDEGDLNFGSGGPVVGIRYLPTGNEAISPGCLCEGWGAAATNGTVNVAGGANRDDGGPFGLSLNSFASDGTNATSVVTIGGATPVLRVTHFYHPSASSNLYQVDVTIENISLQPVTALYRRVMDWDVQPTAFSEYVTIVRGTASDIVFTSDDGFAPANPLAAPTSIQFTGEAVDSGPADHGALFDFNFGTLPAGASKRFRIFYGAAGSEADATTALAVVGAEAFSFGQPSGTGGPDFGVPNTFLFAFSGIGGAPVVIVPRQPDNLIKNSNEVLFMGNNVYETNVVTQAKARPARRGQKKVFHVKIQNDSAYPDTLTVKGDGAAAGFRVKYFAGITGVKDITTAVTNGTCQFTGVATNESRSIRLEITPATTAAIGSSNSCVVTTRSASDTNKSDSVQATVSVAR
jgi:hypothetical protein